MDTKGNIPYPFVPIGFVEPGINVHFWIPHLLQGKFPDFSEHPRGRFLEANSTDVHVNVNVFSDHHVADSRMALLTTLLGRIHSARPKLERKGARDCGKESHLAWI